MDQTLTAKRWGEHAHVRPSSTAGRADSGRDGTRLSVEVLYTEAAVAALEGDIRSLEAASHNTVPFACCAWQIAWCRHFLKPRHGIVDRLMYPVLRDGGRCVAAFPMISTTRRVYGFDICSLGPLGADPGLTEIRAPLIEPGYEERATTALALALNDARQWDWIEWIQPRDEFARVLGTARQLHWQPMASSYVLPLPPTWEEFRLGLKRNIRESLRHCYNSLKRSGYGFDFRVTRDAAGAAAAVTRLFELHHQRAEMTGHVSHPNRFASPAIRDFMLDVCHEFAVRGELRVFELEIMGRVAASRIGFVVGAQMYLYYSGFDPAWSRFSVMTTTVAEIIKYCIAEGFQAVNLSPGEDVSKTRWGPAEAPYQRAYECAERLRSRVAHYAYLKAKSHAGLRQGLLRPLSVAKRRWV